MSGRLHELRRAGGARVRHALLHGPVAAPAWRARAVVAQVGSAVRGDRPQLSVPQSAVLDELRATAVAATSLSALGLAATDSFLDAVAELRAALPEAPSLSEDGDRRSGRSTWLHCRALDAAALARRWPPILLLGVDPQLLALVERYLGVPPALTAVDLRQDVGTGEQVGTRIWHLDTEDHRNLRMMVYLSDVGPDDGPFEYVPLSVTERLGALHDRARRAEGDPILDDELERTVPRARWQRVLGPAGTVALADNTRLLHHSAVHRSSRLALLYTFTSRHPRYPALVRNPRYDDWLTPYQRRALRTG